MSLLVLRDPSRSKQAVTFAGTLWRERGQNLNIDLMQSEIKCPIPLMLRFWMLFIAVDCVFLAVVEHIRLYPKRRL